MKPEHDHNSFEPEFPEETKPGYRVSLRNDSQILGPNGNFLNGHEKERLCRIANHHEELVAALEDLLSGEDVEKDKALAEMFGPNGASKEIAREQARSLLSKIKGTK